MTGEPIGLSASECFPLGGESGSSVERKYTLQFPRGKANASGPGDRQKRPRELGQLGKTRVAECRSEFAYTNCRQNGTTGGNVLCHEVLGASMMRRMAFGGSRPRRLASSLYVVVLPGLRLIYECLAKTFFQHDTRRLFSRLREVFGGRAL